MTNVPDMIQVSVRSELPEFQDLTIEQVFAGRQLKWLDFLHYNGVHLDPKEHIVRGVGNRSAMLSDTIGNYVDAVKRRLKVYCVTIERIKTEPASNGSSPATVQQNSRGATKRRIKRPKKWSDEEDNVDPLSFPSKIESQSSTTSTTSAGLSSTSPSSTSSASSLSTNGKVLEPVPTTSTSTFFSANVVGQQSTSSLSSHYMSAPKKLHVSRYLEESNNKMARYDNGGIPQGLQAVVINPQALSTSVVTINTAAIATNSSIPTTSKIMTPLENGHNGINGDEHVDNGEEVRKVEARRNSRTECIIEMDERMLKSQVIQFLVQKISNRNMLRIREELLQLRANDDYFKLTSLAPLSAGLLEQMFCSPRIPSNNHAPNNNNN